jgi:hypothetical protein
VNGENALFNERLRPDLREQLALGHQMPGATDERHQDVV